MKPVLACRSETTHSKQGKVDPIGKKQNLGTCKELGCVWHSSSVLTGCVFVMPHSLRLIEISTGRTEAAAAGAKEEGTVSCACEQGMTREHGAQTQSQRHSLPAARCPALSARPCAAATTSRSRLSGREEGCWLDPGLSRGSFLWRMEFSVGGSRRHRHGWVDFKDRNSIVTSRYVAMLCMG